MDRTDPSGLYECSGDTKQCGAVEESYNRAKEALSSGKLTKTERTKLKASLTVVGKPGEKNGVTVRFASREQILAGSSGKATVAYTTPVGRGAIHIVLNKNFPTLYNNYRGRETPGQDYSKLSPEDERAAILAHEGKHVEQFRNGMTLESYNENRDLYEDDAQDAGRAINHANGSTSIHEPRK